MPHLLAALLTPTCAPHACLLTCGLAHFLTCTLPLWFASSLARFNSRFLSRFLLPPLSLALLLLLPPLSFHFSRLCFLPQNGPPIRFISAAVSAGAVRPKLTPPHLRTVTMTTRALGKRRASALAKEMNVKVSVEKKNRFR